MKRYLALGAALLALASTADAQWSRERDTGQSEREPVEQTAQPERSESRSGGGHDGGGHRDSGGGHRDSGGGHRDSGGGWSGANRGDGGGHGNDWRGGGRGGRAYPGAVERPLPPAANEADALANRYGRGDESGGGHDGRGGRDGRHGGDHGDHGRGDGRGWHDDGRRGDHRDWDDDRHGGGHRGGWNGRHGGGWDGRGHDYRHRYDWHDGRWYSRHGGHYGDYRGWHHGWNNHRWRAPYRYVYPRGYYSRRWSIGLVLPTVFYSGYYANRYYIDWQDYDLEPPPWGCEWVRVDNDLLLVEVRSGRIVDALYGFFY
jgi:Ni/Co efflux regulator RcnB